MKIIRGTILLIAFTMSSCAVNNPAPLTTPTPEDYLYYYLLGLKAEGKITPDPLIVVDGSVYTYDKLKESGLNLSRRNIYDIACLGKDNVTAASLYGEKGKGGVVLITTAKTHDRMSSTSPDYKVLFIVGGKKLSLDEVYTIDPYDIEKVYAIKDKEEIRKYTRHDYDGVVIITMKDGKEFSKGKKYKYN